MIAPIQRTAIHEGAHLAAALRFGWRVVDARLHPRGIVTATSSGTAADRLLFAVAGAAVVCVALASMYSASTRTSPIMR